MAKSCFALVKYEASIASRNYCEAGEGVSVAASGGE
jgi:hypothetical protein